MFLIIALKFNLPTFTNYDLQFQFYEIKQTQVTARSKETEEGSFYNRFGNRVGKVTTILPRSVTSLRGEHLDILVVANEF